MQTINRAAVVFFASGVVCSACLAEPQGIRPAPESGARDEVTTGGQPSDGAASRVACEGPLIVEEKCGRCHGASPQHGAPFPLTSSKAVEAIDAKGVPRRERMADAVERGTMPPSYIELDPPVVALTDDERQTLLEWLRAESAEDRACRE